MLLTNMEPVLYLLNYVIKHGFLAEILAITGKSVPLYCVFHSIRF